MHDSIAIPACFSSGDRPSPSSDTIRSGQSVLMSVYRLEIAGKSRVVTVTWCKNLLLRGLSVSIQSPEENDNDNDNDKEFRSSEQRINRRREHRIELNPWCFWRNRHGEKQLILDGDGDHDDGEELAVRVVWDLRSAKFSGETEPRSGYFVAIVSGEEVSLVVGDLKKEAYRRTGNPPSLLDPVLVSRREHLFGKNRFSTRANLKATSHEISIGFDQSAGSEPELEVRVDGDVALHVTRLHWKFRGNEVVSVGKNNNGGFRVQIFWDVHDWLFSSGTRHGMFIFSPVSDSDSSSSSSCHQCNGNDDDEYCDYSSRFSLFIYAWKVE